VREKEDREKGGVTLLRLPVISLVMGIGRGVQVDFEELPQVIPREMSLHVLLLVHNTAA
jgi:hypothetical protein